MMKTNTVSSSPDYCQPWGDTPEDEGETLDMKPCMTCGVLTPLALLDAKPKRLAGPIVNADEWLTELMNALWANEDCEHLDCERCYGPGWS